MKVYSYIMNALFLLVLWVCSVSVVKVHNGIVADERRSDSQVSSGDVCARRSDSELVALRAESLAHRKDGGHPAKITPKVRQLIRITKANRLIIKQLAFLCVVLPELFIIITI